MNNLILITGGVRSGKSLFAESLARQSGVSVFYFATMPPLDGDAEQQTRIERHKRRRPENWKTVEAPYTLPEAIAELPNQPSFCLIECLSVYVSNLILGDNPDLGPPDAYAQESRLFSQVDAIIENIKAKNKVNFAVVTNEVGWGVVPDNQLSRAFRDFLGLANQTFAKNADHVWLTVAGIPMHVK